MVQWSAWSIRGKGRDFRPQQPVGALQRRLEMALAAPSRMDFGQRQHGLPRIIAGVEGGSAGPVEDKDRLEAAIRILLRGQIIRQLLAQRQPAPLPRQPAGFKQRQGEKASAAKLGPPLRREAAKGAAGRVAQLAQQIFGGAGDGARHLRPGYPRRVPQWRPTRQRQQCSGMPEQIVALQPAPGDGVQQIAKAALRPDMARQIGGAMAATVEQGRTPVRRNDPKERNRHANPF